MARRTYSVTDEETGVQASVTVIPGEGSTRVVALSITCPDDGAIEPHHLQELERLGLPLPRLTLPTQRKTPARAAASRGEPEKIEGIVTPSIKGAAVQLGLPTAAPPPPLRRKRRLKAYVSPPSDDELAKLHAKCNRSAKVLAEYCGVTVSIVNHWLGNARARGVDLPRAKSGGSPDRNRVVRAALAKGEG